MPATVLTRVDLPAPLSPTSAMTSTARTSKSTSASAWTDPNDFEILRSSKVGVSVTVPRFLPQRSGEGAQEAPPPLDAVLALLAVLRELADADVALLEELVLEEPGVVRLRNRDDRDLNGGLLLAAVLAEPVDPGHLLVMQQRDGRLGSSIGLVRHVLVDGHRLPARDDVLHALHGRVLSRKSDWLQLLRLQGSDHSAGDAVVRSDGAVDLVARRQQHLLEDGLRVRREPERHELLRAFRQLAALEQRVQNRVVPALEPERVLIGRAAPELGNNGLRLVLESVDDALGLGRADCLAVEADVDLGDAAHDLAVVVDRRAPCLRELLLDRNRRALGDVGDDGNLRVARQTRIRLRDHLLRIVQRVRDRVGHLRLLQGLGEVRCVELLPAD